MSLSSIGNATSIAASQFIPLSSTSKVASSGDPGTSTGGSSGLSRFASAISEAFASIGISLDGTSDTSTSSASSTSASTTSTAADASTTDGSDALGAFLQSLLAALHGQSAGSAPPPPPDDGSSSDQTPSAPSVDAASATGSSTRTDDVGRAHHGHGGKLEADLQSLIQELQSSSDSTDTSTPGTVASTTSSTSTDPTLATLEKNFDSLLATNGSSSTGSSDSLSAFLQSLASALHGAPPTGNVLTTQA